MPFVLLLGAHEPADLSFDMCAKKMVTASEIESCKQLHTYNKQSSFIYLGGGHMVYEDCDANILKSPSCLSRDFVHGKGAYTPINTSQL